LQEDKRPLFDSVDSVRKGLDVFVTMLPEVTVHPARMEEAAADPNLMATDLAEYLVKKGMPFREAHEAVGKLVARATASGVSLDQIPSDERQKISPLLEGDLAEIFDARHSLAQRTALGAPSPENVAAQIARWRALL
jgi:argininosuccinate lyase